MTEPTAGRRTFGPVVLLGVVAGVVLAVSGSEAWFVPEGRAGDDSTLVAYAYTSDAGVVTSANALALVGLACWGVILVTRGRFRRVIAGLGLLAAVGGVVTVVSAYLTTPDDVRAQFEELTVDSPAVVSTGWFWVGTVAAMVSLAAWVVAVRYVRYWPEMGTRYDSPSDSPPEDLWKALDQGHDPTS